jgi:succinylglutamic semialdehyde dehydrogenase
MTHAPVKELEFRGDYINGKFVRAERADGEIVDRSPSDLKDTVLRADYSYDHVAMASAAARKAFYGWASMKAEERFGYLRRLKEIYLSQADRLAEVISRDTGKPIWEAKTEVTAMIGKIDITIDFSMKLVAEERVPNALPNTDGVISHRPRGVMAVLGPFNFPGHLPNGHIIPALATGNTVVFKPSEQTPAVGQLMAECYDMAKFPPGVFNLVHGEAETGKRLAAEDQVDAVLFTGSYDVGLKIKQKTLEQHWKLLALEMGGKNATIVWKDADINKAIYESLLGSFLTAGQRCSCTSRLILHKSIAPQFIEKFYETAKKLSIGHWRDSPFMGPLINADAVEKYLRFQEIASREGAERLMRGKVLDVGYEGYYVTPSICLVPKASDASVYQKSEIFGPNVAIYQTESFEEALQINDMTGFGLSMALFTKDKALYEEARMKARVGLLNWNRTTNGASSKLPFGGLGKSGNDRPTAHYAVQYCTTPMASIEDMAPFDPKAQMPGVNFEPL